MAEEIESVRKLVTPIVESLIARAEQQGKQLDSLFVVIDARQALATEKPEPCFLPIGLISESALLRMIAEATGVVQNFLRELHAIPWKRNCIRSLIVTPHEAELSELELGDYAQNQDAEMSEFKFTGPGGDA